jgi:hypothetical protein
MGVHQLYYLPAYFFQSQGAQLKTGSMMLTVFLIGAALAAFIRTEEVKNRTSNF